MYDPDYGDYREALQPPNGHSFSRVHYVRFLASKQMGREEPSPQQVLNEVRRVLHHYRTCRDTPRKYSICISPVDVVVRELKSFHEETISTKYIHYCVHDEEYPNIFVFVAWSQSRSVFLAHIFFCSDEMQAANLKAAFAHGFQAAYRDWKNDSRPSPRRGRDSYSEYAPARLTRRALDHHRRAYEAPAIMEREQYRPPARVATPKRPRARAGPRPNQLIEVYGDPRRGGYDYDDDDDVDDFPPNGPPPARPAVEKEVVYTRETFPSPTFGNDVYEGRNGMRGGGYDDGIYGGRGGIYGIVDRGRRSRRYVDPGYARDDMFY